MIATPDNFVRESTSTSPSTSAADDRPDSVEQLVAVRADVLHDAEHAIGNLFQRMYHVSRAARDGLGPYAERLSASLQDLERLLELLFDYVTPTELELRRLDCGRVAESLIAHLRAHSAATVTCDIAPDAAVLVDPRIIGRIFQLVARGFASRVREDSPIVVRVERNSSPDRVELQIESAVAPVAPAADVRLAFGVAGRLVELHGGELSLCVTGERARCVVSLPSVQPET